MRCQFSLARLLILVTCLSLALGAWRMQPAGEVLGSGGAAGMQLTHLSVLILVCITVTVMLVSSPAKAMRLSAWWILMGLIFATFGIWLHAAP